MLLRSLFENLTGGQSPIGYGTELTRGAFQSLGPSRSRVCRPAFLRRKYNAELTLARFAAVARDEVDMDMLTAELLVVVQDTMQPEEVSLWLRA